MIRAGILNVTGYVGAELARLLAGHPQVTIAGVTGRSQAGKRLAEVFPHLWSVDLPITEELEQEVDVVVSALPHTAAAEALARYVEAGVAVIDCSADFRLHDAESYERWYSKHPVPELLKRATFGLPELHREAIRQSRLVAVPGCYPTASILALAPLVAGGVIEPEIVVDAKSGVSGAGRTLKLSSHFSEVEGSLSAYGLEGHRHQPEIAQELNALSPDERPLQITFVPHLVPMTRGMFATAYTRARPGALPEQRENAIEALRERYETYYASHPFVHVAAAPPSTKQALGSNACLVYPTIDINTGRIVTIGCLDNLVKGAAGAAVQCLNLMFDLDERAGLTTIGLYP